VAETEAPLVELLEEVRPLARQLAVVLVRQELDGLATSLNGAAPSGLGPTAETAVSGPENTQEPRLRPGPKPKPAPAKRRCNRCGQTKPASEYGRGRGTCRSCRRAQQREHDRRVALAEHEEPHPDTGSPSVDRWLLERGLAEQRDGELVATDAGRELGGAIFG
jgi:hypothetical protein